MGKDGSIPMGQAARVQAPTLVEFFASEEDGT
jgi:hypothetical protein